LLSFAEVFGREPQASGAAPGRVNLLGEHTDYSGGFVLPTAIPQVTQVQAASGQEGWQVYSATTGERVGARYGEPVAPGFARYVQGCLEVLRSRGIVLPPVLLHVSSCVPIGVGLSSSAALSVALLRAVRSLAGFDMDDVTLALCAQQAERDYAGVQVGVMDPMACTLCVPGSMLFLDTRSLEYRLLPLPQGAEILVIDSGTPRDLANTAYNQRRTEVELAARLLGVEALRDVSDPAAGAGLPPPLDRRVRHVVGENRRVLEALEAAAERFGALMSASHASLRDDYEVSTPALDALVAGLQAQPGTFGARLTGAGFGGACVALVRAGAGAAVAAGALAAYRRSGRTGRVLVGDERSPERNAGAARS
jgi:galactokinase